VRRRRDRLASALLAAAVLLYVGVLLGAPVVALLWSALEAGPVTFLRAMLGEGGAHALFLSLMLAAIAVAANLVLGTLVALVLTRDRFPGRSLLSALVDLPMAVSPVVAGFALILLYGPRGWFGPALAATDLRVVFALPGMALVTIFVSLPLVVREVSVALEQAEQDQEDAAYTLGAGPITTFFRITLPSIRHGLIYGVLLTTARSLGEFGAVLVVSGGVAELTETGTLFVFRSLDDRRDLAAYSMAVTLAALSMSLILGLEPHRRAARRRADRVAAA
jgi:sulfate transport system permease protein